MPRRSAAVVLEGAGVKGSNAAAVVVLEGGTSSKIK